MTTSPGRTLILWATLLTLPACGNCKSSAEDADTFVRNSENQTCEVDDDCVVVRSNCSPMKTTFCGQVAMSADAAASEEWKEIEQGLEACDSDCSVCLAALIPSCTGGSCRAPD